LQFEASLSKFETVSQKYPSRKKAGGVSQGVGLEFKPQYWGGGAGKDLRKVNANIQAKNKTL
jgi:hypothetical protein